MSGTSQNLSLGAAVAFPIDPTIPQSVQQSANQIMAAANQHVALINATTKGGRPRRRRTSRRSYRGGVVGVGGVGAETIPGDPTTIVVAPLPLGANTPNAQANNVAAAALFAHAVTASTYDNAVTQPKVGGGNRRRRTRRLSKKRTHRMRRTKRRSTKYRKMRKVKKSRRSRR